MEDVIFLYFNCFFEMEELLYPDRVVPKTLKLELDTS